MAFWNSLAKVWLAVDRAEWLFDEKMPVELRQAALLMSETVIRLDRPIPISAKPDQLYELTDGSLVLVDTKVRAQRVIQDDIRLAMSVYRFVLCHTDDPRIRGRTIRPYAWVRFKTLAGVSYDRCDVWDDDVVIEAWMLAHLTRGHHYITAP